MKSSIYFIRHGKTEGTEKGWYYGQADLHLVQEGIDHTKQLAQEGTYPDGEDAQFVTTGLNRTEQTLNIIYGDVDHHVIPELQEMNFGDYECKTFKECDADPAFMSWCEDVTGMVAFPNGESRAEFKKRIHRGLDKLKGYHQLKEFSHRHSGKDANTVMICHGGVISTCMRFLLDKENDTMWDWCPEPGHGFRVDFEDGKVKGYEKF
ncbi:MAG: histidine phosphatase family protein [Clostridia bacterium]|nr:histidine phosphatase family protein [Clostridia bacterium]